MMDNFFLIGLICWNVIVFIIYGFDKLMAIKNKRRISEKKLLIIAFLMGGAGAFFGMRFFRHKTRHRNFKIFVPIATFLNGLLLFFIPIFL